MAIKKDVSREKERKLNQAIETLNKEEVTDREKTKKVIQKISGKDSPATRIIHDKNGRVRTVKIPEKRKSLSIYVPQSLYEQFDKLTTYYGTSNNGEICRMIREYVENRKNILSELN